ncbi:Two-component response regulator 24 [Stylosanthes scabra]|uniref:Two-component response regulator 24 n=1 Tax=Stylosanthes scabra TaxID=79078 RepID=A0ABU6QEE3_9FABA|nr:Two-component response regulator 24 [Stylosanthes scabra]
MTSQNLSTQLRALVVDDNILNRKIHERMLNGLGVECMVVANGKEAVDVHFYGQSFDLILMDKDMPIMNGIEATKELRSMGINSLIVGVSSRSMEAEIREFMEAGLNDYHVKPLTTHKLASIIHNINPNYATK